jgi:hypothetical protein
LGVIAAGTFDRIARIADPDEVHALDDSTVANVQTGNNALS